METPWDNDEPFWDNDAELNDDGYPVGYHSLDAGDPDNYDPVDEGEAWEGPVPTEPSDSDEWWDNDTPVGLEYDGYNDPEDY